MTTEPSKDVVPSWSRDGRFVHFASSRTGTWQVWSMPAEGGSARQVTRAGGFLALESLDGRFLYYCRYDAAGLWRVPVEGGQEVRVLDDLEASYWGHWGLGPPGIFYVRVGSDRVHDLRLLRAGDRRGATLGRLRPAHRWAGGLGVSPDGRHLLYGTFEREESDLIGVENFR